MRITATSLVNGETATFSDFNVFTGGNGVGKSTLLAELFDKAGGIPRSRFHWISTPTYESLDLSGDIFLLRSSLARQWEGSNLFYYSSATKNKDGQVDLDNALRFGEIDKTGSVETLTPAVFDQPKFRRPFVTYLSCDARLGLPNEVGLIGLHQPPQDPINVLARASSLRRNIDRTISNRFSFHFVLLDLIRTQLQLGISRESPPTFDTQADDQQAEYERIDQWRVKHFQPMLEAGHGIRSMVRLLTGLLEPVNTVILIDEPEMHLAPVQKRWLGKEMVRLASAQKKQVFLVTHDPMVLQGVFDASAATTVFRLDRDPGSAGVLRSCELSQLSDATATRNQEQFLQGLFYQRCIVVEGATDRSFYQNLVEDCAQIADRDIGFVACGGKGSTKHMAHLSARVGMRTAFIYDFDVLFNLRLLSDIYVSQGGLGDPLTAFEAALPETIKSEAVEATQVKSLKSLLQYSEKKGISGQWVTEHQEVISKTLADLRSKGIFLVPSGTMESWAPDVEPKVRFAELAPDVVRSNGQLRTPLDTFLRQVLSWLGVDTPTVIATK